MVKRNFIIFHKLKNSAINYSNLFILHHFEIIDEAEDKKKKERKKERKKWKKEGWVLTAFHHFFMIKIGSSVLKKMLKMELKFPKIQEFQLSFLLTCSLYCLLLKACQFKKIF